VDEYTPLHAASEKGGAFEGLAHMLCCFHLYNLGWKRNVICDKLMGHTGIKTVHDWVKTWLYGCETLAELDRSQPVHVL